GVGSMRVLLDQPDLLPTFDVRPARPPRLFANLGAQQLVQRGREAAHRLIDLIGADGIAVHLNAAQELVQERGDRDFTGCLDAIGRLAEELGERLIVKETGCGIGPDVVRELIARKVRVIDVSGAGGTSWTRVEQLRAQTPEAGALGELLSDWGLPTAACIGAAVRVLSPKKGPRVRVIASGGVRSGLDVARALALGADLAGFALPMVRAHQGGGIDAARAALHGAIAALRAACLLVGARDVQALRASRPVLLEPLPSTPPPRWPPPSARLRCSARACAASFRWEEGWAAPPRWGLRWRGASRSSQVGTARRNAPSTSRCSSSAHSTARPRASTPQSARGAA